MKSFLSSTFAIALLALASNSAGAMNSMSGSSMMMQPKCAAGDSVVGVNTQTKMYMTKAQMDAKMAGMSASQKHAMMMKNHMSMMCMSKAKGMGAKMMGSKM